MRKTGVGFDFAIALALLATDEQIPAGTLGDYVVCGELRSTARCAPSPACSP
jgi:predicted ATPase with chaperone activity